MRKLLRRPSPGLILACVALFVALGGGAYAATSDTKSDKKIAKKAAKSYFNGHIGGASVSHANSATNANTLGGVAASGYTQTSQDGIFATFKNGPITFPHTAAAIATLSVPAGSYAVFAKYYGNDPSNSPVVTCILSAGGDTDQSVIDLSPLDQNASLQLVHTFSSTGTVALTCSKDLTTTTDTANWIKITAIRAPSVSNTASP